MVHLRDDEVEEAFVLRVLDDVAAPGRVPGPFFVEIGERDVRVVVACPSFYGLEVEFAAICGAPARIADAGFGTWRADACQTAVLVGLALECLCYPDEG